MNKYKIQIYTLIILGGIIMIFLIDNDQVKKSAPLQNSTENIFSPNDVSDPFDLVPPNWTRVTPKSSMRLAEFNVNNNSGSYDVIVFKNIGGTENQNIERWFNQFSGDYLPQLEKQSESMDIRGSKLIYVQTSGSFNGGMGQSAPIDAAGLMGFIINTKEDVYYFKAVADAKIIAEGKRDFVQTVLSLPIF